MKLQRHSSRTCYDLVVDLQGSQKALNVVVRLFASYRERAGLAQVDVGLPDGATVAELADEVLRRYPDITADRSRLVVAVNEEYADHGHRLSDGDEVALIPPVSGGAGSAVERSSRQRH